MPSAAAAMLDVPDDVISRYDRAIIALLLEVSFSVTDPATDQHSKSLPRLLSGDGLVMSFAT